MPGRTPHARSVVAQEDDEQRAQRRLRHAGAGLRRFVQPQVPGMRAALRRVADGHHDVSEQAGQRLRMLAALIAADIAGPDRDPAGSAEAASARRRGAEMRHLPARRSGQHIPPGRGADGTLCPAGGAWCPCSITLRPAMLTFRRAAECGQASPGQQRMRRPATSAGWTRQARHRETAAELSRPTALFRCSGTLVGDRFRVSAVQRPQQPDRRATDRGRVRAAATAASGGRYPPSE